MTNKTAYAWRYINSNPSCSMARRISYEVSVTKDYEIFEDMISGIDYLWIHYNIKCPDQYYNELTSYHMWTSVLKSTIDNILNKVSI